MTHDPLCPAPKDWWRSCICKELGMAESRGYQTGLLVGKTTFAVRSLPNAK